MFHVGNGIVQSYLSGKLHLLEVKYFSTPEEDLARAKQIDFSDNITIHKLYGSFAFYYLPSSLVRCVHQPALTHFNCSFFSFFFS